VTAAVGSPRAAASVWLAGYQAARARFQPRPDPPRRHRPRHARTRPANLTINRQSDLGH
jgi:hypothetical protein